MICFTYILGCSVSIHVTFFMFLLYSFYALFSIVFYFFFDLFAFDYYYYYHYFILLLYFFVCTVKLISPLCLSFFVLFFYHVRGKHMIFVWYNMQCSRFSNIHKI